MKCCNIDKDKTTENNSKTMFKPINKKKNDIITSVIEKSILESENAFIDVKI